MPRIKVEGRGSLLVRMDETDIAKIKEYCRQINRPQNEVCAEHMALLAAKAPAKKTSRSRRNAAGLAGESDITEDLSIYE